MGPPKKSRIMKKHVSELSDDCHDKDGSNSAKSKQRKRKLSDMLGSQWSKEELECFYEAYQQYGKDWKKVAGTIRNKSSNMVEALYKMNKAILSLQEGVSADGFIAIMKDRYNILDGKDFQKADDVLRKPHKPQKQGSRKLPPSAPKKLCVSHLNHFNYGGSIGGSRPRAVGKRTPRAPVRYMHETDDNTFLPCEEVIKSKENLADGVQAAIDALSGRSLGGGTEKVCGASSRSDQRVLSHFRPFEREVADAKPKIANNNNDFGMDVECWEACSGIEEAVCVKSTNDEFNSDRTEGKTLQTSKMSKNGEQLSTSQCSSLDALNALADLAISFLSPSATDELEALEHADKLKENVDSIREPNVPGKLPVIHGKDQTESSVKRSGRSSSVLKINFTKGWSSKGSASYDGSQRTNSSTSQMPKRKKYLQPRIAKAQDYVDSIVGNLKKYKVSIEEGNTSNDRQLAPVRKQGKSVQLPECYSIHTSSGREELDLAKSFSQDSELNMPTKTRSRRKIGLNKIMELKELKSSVKIKDTFPFSDLSSGNSEVFNIKGKLSNCLSSHLLRRWCMFEWFYSSIDYPWFSKCDFVNYLKHVHLGHVSRLSRAEWSTIRSSLGKPRRLSKQFLLEERNKLEQYRESVRKHYTELRTGVGDGLPSDLARPFFVGQRVIARNPEMVEIHDGRILTVYHNHFRVQFDNSELGVKFVRDIDCMPQSPWENFHADLSRQNATVVELHSSSSGSMHGGYFLDPSLCRSLNLAPDEISEITYGGFSNASSRHPLITTVKQTQDDTLDDAMNKAGVAPIHVLNSQLYTSMHSQVMEMDVVALSDLSRALEKKETLIMELKHLNDEVSEKQKDTDLVGSHEQFKEQYSILFSLLSDARSQVKSGLHYLSQRNIYLEHLGNSSPIWFRSRGISKHAGLVNCSNTYDLDQHSSSYVTTIFESSRQEARAIFDETMQTIVSLREKEASVAKFREIIGSVKYGSSLVNPSTSENIESSHHHQVPSSMVRSNASDEKVQMPDAVDARIPSELISACAATFLMIQYSKTKRLREAIHQQGERFEEISNLAEAPRWCTCWLSLDLTDDVFDSTQLSLYPKLVGTCAEGRYPPAEVAELLERAVASLQPCCSENLPIYNDIETCMGFIKTQILALVPTPTAITPCK